MNMLKRLLTCALLLFAGYPIEAAVISAVPLTDTGVNLSTAQTSAAGATDPRWTGAIPSWVRAYSAW